MARSAILRVLAVAALLALTAGIWYHGHDRMLLGDLEYLGTWGPGYAIKNMAYWLGLGGVQAAAMGLLILAGMMWPRLRLSATGWAGLVSVAVSGLLVQVIKHIVGRPRPGQNMDAWQVQWFTFDSDMHSFPSGHAATTFALAAVLAARWPRWAWLFYLTACGVAVGRVVGGSHFLSDVSAGAALGLVCGWLLAWRFKLREDAR